jgi:hypothetical protein
MRAVILSCLAIGSLLAGVVHAQTSCSYPARHPGAQASKGAVAAWMAARATDRGLPGELPVMAALVRSNLLDESLDRSGRAGYFQMLNSLWESGPYAGYRNDPGVQIDWFTNQLVGVRDRAIFLGTRRFGERPTQWGEWISLALAAGRPDVYERRLQEARELISSGCAEPPPSTCTFIAGYPGDDASQMDTASWMAGRAQQAGLPPELPIMAALVESGLKNLDYGDADSVGFFLMRTSIWDNGPYAGFPDDPGLQMKWFIDHALEVRAERIAAGNLAFGNDPLQWGEWVADVERPADQFRGRYQLRLGDARKLIELACDH